MPPGHQNALFHVRVVPTQVAWRGGGVSIPGDRGLCRSRGWRWRLPEAPAVLQLFCHREHPGPGKSLQRWRVAGLRPLPERSRERVPRALLPLPPDRDLGRERTPRRAGTLRQGQGLAEPRKGCRDGSSLLRSPG